MRLSSSSTPCTGLILPDFTSACFWGWFFSSFGCCGGLFGFWVVFFWLLFVGWFCCFVLFDLLGVLVSGFCCCCGGVCLFVCFSCVLISLTTNTAKFPYSTPLQHPCAYKHTHNIYDTDLHTQPLPCLQLGPLSQRGGGSSVPYSVPRLM